MRKVLDCSESKKFRTGFVRPEKLDKSLAFLNSNIHAERSSLFPKRYRCLVVAYIVEVYNVSSMLKFISVCILYTLCL